MKQFLKNTWFIIFLLIIFFVFLIGSFYWFQWRPTRIRHDCSWGKKHSNAIMEITQEQYEECRNKCPAKTFGEMIKLSSFCFCDNPRLAQPAKDWWEPASNRQYDFCIHEKGL